MNTYDRIVFVCTGNTAMSPMAAAIMVEELSDIKDKRIAVESRGMVVLFPEPYNPKAVAVAAMHKLIMPSIGALQLTDDDFGNNTLVLVMDKAMKKRVYELYGNAINVYTIGEFVGETDVYINDPYGRQMEDYNRCFEQLRILIKQAAVNIKKAYTDSQN